MAAMSLSCKDIVFLGSSPGPQPPAPSVWPAPVLPTPCPPVISQWSHQALRSAARSRLEMTVAQIRHESISVCVRDAGSRQPGAGVGAA